MADAITIALSGLRAQTQRLGATASNIANATTSGAVPGSDAPAGSPALYRPLRVDQTAIFTADGQGAGVRAEVSADEDGITRVYDPDSSFADSEGFVAVPQIELTEEITNLLVAKTAYKANLSVIKTEKELQDQLLDTLA